MKIKRRDFLSFVVGGAAGTALSPLPWKLPDDLAIWTQMWPWTPVPEVGEVTHVNSTCSLCPAGCGITVRKVGERTVKIEGQVGHPVNDGGICILGLAGLQLLYGPRRIKAPLKRAGKRGEGKWVESDWETAMGEIADSLKTLREKDTPQKLGVICGTDRGTVAQLLSRFLTAYGSPNFIRTPSMADNYELTLYLTQGLRGRVGFDFDHSDFVLSFGSGIIDGWGSPVAMFKANSRWKSAGVKTVQIESRLSNTAAKAEEWIPINPGTEGALALGLAHVIIAEKRQHKAMTRGYAAGFDEWAKMVADNFSPEKTAQITGIEKGTIVALARRFAQARRPVAICGRGRGETPGNISEFMAVHALNGLMGRINMAGGVWGLPEPDYIDWPELEMDRIASAGIQNGRLDGAGSPQYPDSRYLSSRFFKAISAGKPYPLEALFIAKANPFYTLPDSETLRQAMDKIPLIVSFSSLMDETAAYADYILPNHLYLERYEDVCESFGYNKPLIGLSRPVIEPQYNTRHVGDTLIGLAQKLGGPVAAAFGWESYQACLEETLADKWDEMLEAGFSSDADYKPAGWGDAFETESNKFEFMSPANQVYAKLNITPPEGDAGTYPLVLVPYDSMRLASGYVGDPPFVMKTVPDTVLKGNDIFVELNPKTARENGLAEGGAAVLQTPKGKVRVRIHLFEGLMPGLVAMPRGLGHTAKDPFLAGKGVNFNALIAAKEDPASGYDAAWGIRAKLSRV